MIDVVSAMRAGPIAHLRKWAIKRGYKIIVRGRRFFSSRIPEFDAVACYSHPKRTIVVNRDGRSKTYDQLLYIIAHELGHGEECEKNPEMWPLYVLSFPSFMSSSKDGSKIALIAGGVVCMIEAMAFRRGEMILDELEISVPVDVSQSLREHSLKRYRGIFGQDDKEAAAVGR